MSGEGILSDFGHLRYVFIESAKKIVTDALIVMMNFLIRKMKAKVVVEIKKISNTLQVSVIKNLKKLLISTFRLGCDGNIKQL